MPTENWDLIFFFPNVSAQKFPKAESLRSTFQSLLVLLLPQVNPPPRDIGISGGFSLKGSGFFPV